MMWLQWLNTDSNSCFTMSFQSTYRDQDTPYVASDLIENYRRDRRDLKEQSSKNTTFQH